MRTRSWALVLPLLLTACVSGAGPGGGTGDRPVVVAAAYPFAWLAERIGGPDIELFDVVKPGVEPHDVELTPRQVGIVQEAAVVVYLRHFQPAVDDAVRAAHGLDLAGTVHPEGDDPHVWLDPTLMQQMADAIAARFSELAPSRAARYGERLAAVRADLSSLDADIRTALRGCGSHDIVTSHAAFAYFARRYGLQQRSITGLSPDSEPSPQRLAEVARYARDHDVSTIFFESLVSPKLARTVADEVGAQTAVLDPIEGVRGSDDYLTVMRRNTATLHTALHCS